MKEETKKGRSHERENNATDMADPPSAPSFLPCPKEIFPEKKTNDPVPSTLVSFKLATALPLLRNQSFLIYMLRAFFAPIFEAAALFYFPAAGNEKYQADRVVCRELGVKGEGRVRVPG